MNNRKFAGGKPLASLSLFLAAVLLVPAIANGHNLPAIANGNGIPAHANCIRPSSRRPSAPEHRGCG